MCSSVCLSLFSGLSRAFINKSSRPIITTTTSRDMSTTEKFVLECKDPVPSDIEVSQAITPVHISEIATEAGILTDELEPYGKYKAKVRHLLMRDPHAGGSEADADANRCTAVCLC